MNVLAIGNSFSQDATRYLHRISEIGGKNITVVNLYIGGCSLGRHYKNMLADSKAYSMEFNGEATGFFVSLKEALLSRDWDFITLQQASNESNDYGFYQPYLDELYAYVKKHAPKAKIGIHQTWAYEQGSDRLCKMMGYSEHGEMLSDIEIAYEKAEKAINADFVIKSGTLFGKLLKSGFEKVHRDTFHATFGAGRYALGLLWYNVLTGESVKDINFSCFDEEVTDKEIEIIKACIG